MLPLRLEIKNFLAYRSPEPIIFEGIHLACITGANGAGKSSLLDAITWCLWGKARARRDEELVHLGQNDMYVQLDFEQEGAVYRVVRRRTRKSGGAGALDLFLVRDNGELETRSESSTRLTQQKINDLLRLDYETFVHSAFLQQGKADAFTTKPPAQRKQILADILGLDRWEAYEEAVKQRLKTISETLAGYDMQMQAIDEDLKREPELRAQLAEAERAQAEAKAALEEAEARLREVETAPADLRNAQEQKVAQERRLRECQRDIENINREITRQRQRAAEFEEILLARVEIEEGYAVLQAARERDNSLDEKFRQLNALQMRRHELERAVDAARNEIRNELAGCQSTIAQLERTIATARPDELAEVLAEVAALEDLQAQYQQFQDELTALEKERSELAGENGVLRTEMNALKKRIDQIEMLDAPDCPLCGQPLSEDHRQQLLVDLRREGSERGDRYRANAQRIEQIGSELAAKKEAATELATELKRLETRKQRAAALQTGVDAANDARQRLSEYEARRAELERILADEDFAHDLREELAALDREQEALGYDGAQHDAVRQQLELYQVYEQRQRQLEIAATALPEVQSALEGALLRCQQAEQTLAMEQEKLAQLEADIEMLTERVVEFQAREQEVARQRAIERRASEQLIVAQQDLRAMDSLRTRREKLEAAREAKRQEKALYEELRVAFGKNGIPAMIIESAIPELEAGANRILSRMTDGRMQITMTTQREKLSGGMAETLDIQIADELGTRSYEMYSGGEAFRINFAIRVALSQLLARRAGAHLRTLFLDEGFGTQDEDGRNKLIEAITTIQDDFSLILVITHIDELRDSFPVHITLSKTGEGSRIRVH
ncbi:MAG: SMC family ATPase [Chloroflexota bacterium]